MPLRSRAFSDLRFSPPERHQGTIRGNKDRHSWSANECVCVAGCAWGTRGRITSPRTCGPRRPPSSLLRGKGAGRHPSSVEEARQWTIGRRYVSVFPLSILLCTNRFLPTPPRQLSATSRSPPLQGNSAAMQRDWMAVSRSNLNGPADGVSAETSLGCRQSFKKGQSVSSPRAAAAPLSSVPTIPPLHSS
jgi:hypothetical protein